MANWIGDESDVWNQWDDALNVEGGGGSDPGTNNPDGEDYDARFVPRGGFARDVYDLMVEYDGTIKGREDQADLLGPSLGDTTDPLVNTDGEDKPWWFRWLSDPKMLAYLIGGVAALALLGPVLEIVANLTE